MLVVSAADLKNVVDGMCHAHEVKTAEAIAAHREKPTLTREEAALTLKVGLSTLWRWNKIGYLKHVRVGNKVMYRASDIDKMLERKGGAL